jgi:plastocyanin
MGRSIVLGGVCIVLGAGIWAYASGGLRVERTENGFEPSRLLIQRGDTVTFVGSVEFWPASDSHPTHGLYPAFDADRALVPGERWSFTFDKPGVWKFHDHLSPGVTGTILVAGDTEESITACLASTNGVTRPECWAAEVEHILQNGGLEDVFPKLASWYRDDPEFRKNCHDVMHVVGAAAYAEFMNHASVVDRPEVAYCGFGFFHGFIETVLVEKGAGSYGEVVAYCDALGKRNPRARGPCYHGIGHAVADLLPSQLWGDGYAMAARGVEVCESILRGEYERVRCTSGVYNALTIAYDSEMYKLAFSVEEGIPICAAQPRVHQDFCYMEMGNGFIRSQPWGRDESLAFIAHLPDVAARTNVMRGYMDTEVRRTIDTINLPDLAQVCIGLERAVAEGCVQGVITGLFGVGKPGKENELMEEFCTLLSPALRSYCVQELTGQTGE